MSIPEGMYQMTCFYCPFCQDIDSADDFVDDLHRLSPDEPFYRVSCADQHAEGESRIVSGWWFVPCNVYENYVKNE